MKIKKILFPSFFIGLSFYYCYDRYNRYINFLNHYKQIEDKKKYIYNIHEELNFNLGNKKNDESVNEIRKKLLKQCEGNILEIGIGNSLNEKFYPKNNFIRITGVDYSKNCYEKNSIKINNLIKFDLQDAENLIYKNNSFDYVVSTFSFEFFYNPRKILNEIKRVLKPNGKVLILTTGLSDKNYLNLYKKILIPYYISKKGMFPNRDWNKIIDTNKDFEIIEKEKFFEGSLYYYVLKNKKNN